MAVDRIDDIVDIKAVEGQLNQTADKVQELLDLIQQVNKTGISLSGNKNFSESAKLRKELADLVKQTELSAKATIADAKASKAAAEAKLAEAKVTTELTKQQTANTKETERQAAAKEKQAAASKKAAQKAQEEQRPYKQLALAFAAAAKEAQDLAAQYGTMDKRAQAAAKRANELNNRLKEIDYSIGNHQRNVGNYGSAFDKVSGSVSNLANNFLALIGIASVGSIFSSSIDEFVEMEKNVRQLQNTLKNLGVPEAFDRISASADKLQKQFGFLDNDEILKTFNQLIVYGKLTEKQINELVPVIIDFAAASGQDLATATSTVLKALEGNSKGLREYGINMKDAKSTTEAFSVIMTQLKPKVDGVAESFANSSAGSLQKAKQDFKDLKEEIGTGLIPVLNFLLQQLLNIGKGFKIAFQFASEFLSGGTGFFQITVDKVLQNPSVQKEIDQLAEQQVGTYNNIKTEIEKSISRKLTGSKEDKKLLEETQKKIIQGFSDQIAKSEEELDKLRKTAKRGDDVAIRDLLVSINSRKQAIASIQAASINTILGIGDPNKLFGSGGSNKDDAAKKAAELAERIRKANFEAAKAAQLENIKLQEDIFKDESKSYDERIEALRQYVQERARLIELERTFEKGAKGLTKEEIVAIETQKQTELNQLVRDGHVEYNKILEQQQKEEQRLTKENADRIKAIHEKLQKDIEKGLKEADERLKKINDDRDERDKKRAELQKELANEITGLVFDVFTSSIEREKNAIQDSIDLLEKKKQKDIEVANATITNAQDRANAITVIEARAAAEKEILQQKQRQLDVKKAQFDKAQSIARIIQETAIGVVQLTASPNPLVKALIPILIAISAAQLARIAATPIPRYRYGTQDHKGGLAIVGDGGKSEGIKLPDGSIMKTASTPQVVDLPKGSKVYPDFEKMMLTATMTRPVVYKQSTRTDRTEIAVDKMRTDVVKAIKKIPQSQYTVENIISKRIRSGNNYNTYLTRNI